MATLKSLYSCAHRYAVEQRPNPTENRIPSRNDSRIVRKSRGCTPYTCRYRSRSLDSHTAVRPPCAPPRASEYALPP